MTLLKIETVSKPPMEASKWLTCQLLIDEEELRSLFLELPSFRIFRTNKLLPLEQIELSHESFLSQYQTYIQTLRNGILPEEELYRDLFSSIFTVTSDLLYALPIGQSGYLVRVIKPVVQLQHHRLHYSKEEGKLRSKNFGPENITWGIQYSYPQLFKDADTEEVFKVRTDPNFPNTALFLGIQRWARNHTLPTPMIIQDKKNPQSFRLGKNCFSWINHHPQLHLNHLKVENLYGY